MWPFIKQRPYDIVASPADEPRDIFVSAFYSAPLAPNFDFIVKGQEADFQAGLDALAKLTDGKVYVGIRKGSSVSVKGVETVEVEGPHPAAMWEYRLIISSLSIKAKWFGRSILPT